LAFVTSPPGSVLGLGPGLRYCHVTVADTDTVAVADPEPITVADPVSVPVPVPVTVSVPSRHGR
jgi:hypothetical protein